MATQEELEIAKQQVEGQRIAYRWMKRHLADFDQSPESAKKISDYMKANGLEFSEENLEKAFQALVAQGVRFTAAAAPVTLAAPVADELPSVPEYFPPMNTKKDIRVIPHNTFRELYFGKHGALFRARIEAVNQR